MILLRPSDARGYFNFGWLDTRHTFSFGDYFDPDNMQFRALRVINEDHIQPGTGFGMHGHRDMEILTWVMEGSLAHKDSMGNGSIIHAGEAQRMSAGTGVRHSEFNPSETESVHLFQIWLLPEQAALPPGYEQKIFPEAGRHNQFQLIASRHGKEGSLLWHQDASLRVASFEAGREATLTLPQDRYGWIQVAHGALTLNDLSLATGDGASVSREPQLRFQFLEPTHLLVFDLA